MFLINSLILVGLHDRGLVMERDILEEVKAFGKDGKIQKGRLPGRCPLKVPRDIPIQAAP